MSSVFSKIIAGDIPAYKIAEDGKHLAFLDAMPLVEGHTLVIPKQETDLIFDIEAEDFKDLWAFAHQVAQKMKRTFPSKRIAIAVVGLEVPHAHIHLIPIRETADMNFANPRLKLTEEEYREIQKRICDAE